MTLGGQLGGQSDPYVAQHATLGTMAKLATKLVGVMKAIEHVPKRGRNTFHGYDYATEADVADAVRKALIENNVILIPSLLDIRERDVQTRREGTQIVTTVMMEYCFTDAESGAQLRFRMAGSGQDGGDKGLAKAITAACKYAQLKSLSIATGDDPEGDEKTDKVAADESGEHVEREFAEEDGQGGWARDSEAWNDDTPPESATDPRAPKKDDCITEGKVRYLYVLMQKVAEARGESIDTVRAGTLDKVQEQLHVAKLEWIPWRGDGYKKLVAWLEALAAKGRG